MSHSESDMEEKLGIVLQARTGSTRLPGKMIMDFHQGQSLLEIILLKLKGVGEKNGIPLVLATTDNARDDELAGLALKVGCNVFRGSEDDVLERFIQCAESCGFEKLIRVCGDNPFLLSSEMNRLIEAFRNSASDYLSFQVNGKPSILTHFGLWTEGVRLDALRKVRHLTNDSFYHEHVTNYIYGHQDDFRVDWIRIEGSHYDGEDIRLTIDTMEDFRMLRAIFAEISSRDGEGESDEIFSYLDEHPDITEAMKAIIAKNAK